MLTGFILPRAFLSFPYALHTSRRIYMGKKGDVIISMYPDEHIIKIFYRLQNTGLYLFLYLFLSFCIYIALSLSFSLSLSLSLPSSLSFYSNIFYQMIIDIDQKCPDFGLNISFILTQIISNRDI